MSANIAIGAHLGQAVSRERDVQIAHKTAEARLAKRNSDANKVAYLRKWQLASDVSLQELTAELMKAKVQLVQEAVERLTLFTKLGAAATKSDKRLEELAVLRGARDCFEGLVQSIVGQSVNAQNALVNQFGSYLVNLFRIVLQGEYAGSWSACPYTFTDVSVVGVTSVEVQSPAAHVMSAGMLLLQILRRLFSQNRRLLPRKGLVLAPKRLVDNVFVHCLRFFVSYC